MPWTETAQHDYARRGKRHSSDLSDREWALISQFLPELRPIGRPRTTNLREVVNAILYLASSGCPPQPDAELVAAIKAVIADMPTYGYRRVHAILCRKALAAGTSLPNHKRVYRVMKAHGLLLQRHAGNRDGRRHDGRVAVDGSNLRWCSDGFEIGCDNGEKVRVAFALDCCGRKHRLCRHHRRHQGRGRPGPHAPGRGCPLQPREPPAADDRMAHRQRLGHHRRRNPMLAREIGLEPRTTPVQSPQSNGMAEAFVRTMKRDYVHVSSLPDARTVIDTLPIGLEPYNTVHPHMALGHFSPREFIASRQSV